MILNFGYAGSSPGVLKNSYSGYCLLQSRIYSFGDWIGHFVGGLAMLVAGAISIFYSIPAYWAKTCRVCDIDIMCMEPDPDCMKNRKAIYQPLLMLLGRDFCDLFWFCVHWHWYCNNEAVF
ncbi:hypothetical protein Ocin01_13293 [Orchesella cincta]|uniref:Uncharacterized protein n=1 Tax=Orchesella cincta TaxID=48709 RepID=A0A1D2MJZ5_ORCCI|nr:hypothetical protein Ocin01_13293 [Orchesella cincta]